MKYLVLTWFIIKVFLVGLLFLTPLLLGLFIAIFNTYIAKGVLVPCDKAICVLIYGERWRTISGKCGEYKLQGRKGYTLIANTINFLAEFFDDEPQHCERMYKDEITTIEFMRLQDA